MLPRTDEHDAAIYPRVDGGRIDMLGLGEWDGPRNTLAALTWPSSCVLEE